MTRRPLLHQLKVVMNKINRRAEASIPQELKREVTERQGRVIGYLCRNQDRDVFQRDVEATFSITRATASKMLTAMERNGLITRSGVEEDARLKKLQLTEKGIDHVKRIQVGMWQFEQMLTRGMTSEEQETLFRLLRKIEENVETPWEPPQTGKEKSTHA